MKHRDFEVIKALARSKETIRKSDALLERMNDPALPSCPPVSDKYEDLLAYGRRLLKASPGEEV